MKVLALIAILFVPSISMAQKLPRNLTCQDLIDYSNGKLSRSTDGGKTFVPIELPKPKDRFGATLLTHATYLCHRLSRDEITVVEFDALYAEKVHQLQTERERALVERQKILMQEKNLENQQRALQNQQQSLRNQGAAIQTQKEAVQAQREAARLQAVQAEIARRQQERQHQEMMEQQRFQAQQLEQLGQQQTQRRAFTCTGGGGVIHCY